MNRCRKVVLMKCNGEPLGLFGSISELAGELEVNPAVVTQSIRQHCRYKGFRFMYYSDYQRIYEYGLN